MEESHLLVAEITFILVHYLAPLGMLVNRGGQHILYLSDTSLCCVRSVRRVRHTLNTNHSYWGSSFPAAFLNQLRQEETH